MASADRYPGAVWKPEGATPGGVIVPRVFVWHSEATRGHAHPHAGLEWHFWFGFDGYIEQLVECDRRADANYKANSFALSAETEDNGDPDHEPWTAAQLDSMVDVGRWASDRYPIALQRCDRWDGTGHGYHTMWGAPSQWTPVAKTCPGAARKAQFPGLLDRIVNPAPVVTVPPLPSTAQEVSPMDFVGQLPTPEGDGCWILLADGAIHTGGNAQYFGGANQHMSPLDRAIEILPRAGAFYGYTVLTVQSPVIGFTYPVALPDGTQVSGTPKPPVNQQLTSNPALAARLSAAERTITLARAQTAELSATLG